VTERRGLIKKASALALLILSIGCLIFTGMALYDWISDTVNHRGTGTKDPVLAVLFIALSLTLLAGAARMVRRAWKVPPQE
jgi:NO-binding membrane sensor protein with MHYT domain